MTGTPDIPEPTFGQRLRMHRERAGKSRAVLGGLVGRSGEWVKALETGRLLTPRLGMLLRLAEVLGVDDLADLTGAQSLSVAAVSKAGHDATPTIAQAMRRPPQAAATTVQALTAQVDQGWQLWHQSGRERSAVATVLPNLLATAQATTRGLSGTERRQASAQLARTYHLVQLFVAFQPSAELVWLSADRARAAAEAADDPTALAAASWYYAHVYRAAGQLDAAEQVAAETLSLLNPDRDRERVLWGKLQLALALTHSKAGREGPAWRCWDQAAAAADSFGAAYTHPWLMFGRPEVDAYSVTINTDLCRAGVAARAGEQYELDRLPSRTRRASLLIDLARAHHQKREHTAVIHALGWALQESVETIRHNGFARMVSLELMDRPGRVARDARKLALTIGTLG